MFHKFRHEKRTNSDKLCLAVHSVLYRSVSDRIGACEKNGGIQQRQLGLSQSLVREVVA